MSLPWKKKDDTKKTSAGGRRRRKVVKDAFDLTSLCSRAAEGCSSMVCSLSIDWYREGLKDIWTFFSLDVLC